MGILSNLAGSNGEDTPLGRGRKGEEKCEEMDEGGWVVSLFVLKEKLRNH